jgi:capsular polysaccharide transport system permease protein
MLVRKHAPWGLLQTVEVLQALILRETRTRFGAHQLGYIWALLEPLALIGTFWFLFTLGHLSPPPGMTILGFLATGFVPFQLFRETLQRTAAAVGSNRALLYYPQVRPLDLILARAALEFSTCVVVLTFILGGEALWLGRLNIELPLGVLAGLFTMTALGMAFGMVTSSLSLYSPSVERVVPFLVRPLFWISAVFYSTNDATPEARAIFLGNPVTHLIEETRSAWFAGYESQHASWRYPLVWLAIALALGLALERASRSRVEVA